MVTLKKEVVFPVILSGGQSSRLFPFNKVLSDLSGAKKTLIQQAFHCAKRLAPASQVYVLTVPAMVPLMHKQIPLSTDHFLSDPARRGTWPAILWAMAHVRRKAPEALLAVLTADHVIPNEPAFLRLARQALERAAREAAVVLLGVKPSLDPASWRGFGCFRVDAHGAVAAFEEKPGRQRTMSMLSEGGWFWNSGMFFFRISSAEKALQLYQPDQFRVYQRICERVAAGDGLGAQRVYEEFAGQIPHPLDPQRMADHTIDYAIVSPLVSMPTALCKALAVKQPIPRWFDIGRWDALRRLLKADKRGNIRLGAVRLGAGLKRCIVAADQDSQVDADGVSNHVIACSQGRALVLPLDRLEEIKSLVAASSASIVGVGLETLDVCLSKNRLVVRPKREFIRSAR